MVDEYYDDYEDYDEDYYEDYDGYAAPKAAPKKTPNQQPKKQINAPKQPKTHTPKKDAKEQASASEAREIELISKKLAKIDIEAEIKARIDSEKANVYMCVIGHVDSGKSTLVGQLSVASGNINAKTTRNLQKIADNNSKSSFALAYAMDSTESERKRGVTIDVGSAQIIELESYNLALLDAPGHRDFVPAMISKGAAAADVAMVVIDATGDKFEAGFARGGQTKEHITIARALGCDKLVVAINKLDQIGFDQTRFDDIKRQLTDFLKSASFDVKKKVTFIPISALSGVGVKIPYAGECSWFKGPTLLEFFNTITPPDRSALRARPLRASVVEISEEPKGIFCRIRVECGTLAIGSKLKVCPTMESAIVNDIIEPPVKALMAGDIGEIVLKGTTLEQIKPVSMLSSFNLSIPKSETVLIQAKIIKGKSAIPITPGLPITFFSRGNLTCGHIKKLVRLLDKNGATAKARPKILKSGDFAEMEITLASAICIELWDEVKELSRIVLRYSSDTIAIGKTIKILQK